MLLTLQRHLLTQN